MITLAVICLFLAIELAILASALFREHQPLFGYLWTFLAAGLVLGAAFFLDRDTVASTWPWISRAMPIVRVIAVVIAAASAIGVITKLARRSE